MMRGKWIFIPSLILLAACSTHAAKDDTAVTTGATSSTLATPATESAATENKNVEIKAEEIVGCEDPSMERTQRLAVIAKLVLNLETELEKNPDAIKDPAMRARMGTFIAGSMSDSTRFISLDRSCWANFYEAQSKLAADDDKSAQEALTRWTTCLSDFFPDRIEIAKPYEACFKAAKSKAKTKK